MRFTIVAAGAFAVVAYAQGSPTVTLTPAQSSAAACLEDCAPEDVECRSDCIIVPSPNDDAAIATNECVAACEKGDGSEAENEAYGVCRDDCIATYFYATSAIAPAPTPTPSSGSGSGSDSGSGSGSGSDDSNDNEDSGSDESGEDNTDGSGSGSGSDNTDEEDSNPPNIDGEEEAVDVDENEGDGEGAASTLTTSSLALLGAFAAFLAL